MKTLKLEVVFQHHGLKPLQYPPYFLSIDIHSLTRELIIHVSLNILL
ncbi:MAG: hypothetical protein QXP91_08170 [Candidatus Methanomethylicia archaeon]